MLSGKEPDKYPDDPLTEEERQRLRRILEDDERARWLWGTLYRLGIAIGALAAAATAVKVFFAGYFLGK